jgi:hypothetical protein
MLADWPKAGIQPSRATWTYQHELPTPPPALSLAVVSDYPDTGSYDPLFVTPN